MKKIILVAGLLYAGSVILPSCATPPKPPTPPHPANAPAPPTPPAPPSPR